MRGGAWVWRRVRVRVRRGSGPGDSPGCVPGVWECGGGVALSWCVALTGGVAGWDRRVFWCVRVSGGLCAVRCRWLSAGPVGGVVVVMAVVFGEWSFFLVGG